MIVNGKALGEMSAEEVKQFVEWTQAAATTTSFPAEIIGYPRCAMLITENKHGNQAYAPVQTVLTFECFVPNPTATNLNRAASLGLMDKALVQIAQSANIGQIMCWVPWQLEDYAEKIQRHGWEEIKGVRLFRKATGVSVNPLSQPLVGEVHE